jgi:hypothetical protein
MKESKCLIRQEDNILVVMADNRKLSLEANHKNYHSLAVFLNYTYCQTFNYGFKYCVPTDGEDMSILNCKSPLGNKRHASWSKLLSCIKMAIENPEYSYVVWVDSDFIFNSFTVELRTYIESLKKVDGCDFENFNFGFWDDRPWFIGKPNAGFFIFKNNIDSINILKDWYSYSSPENNNYHDMGHAWEQVALFRSIYEKYKYCMFTFDDDPSNRSSSNQFLTHKTASNSNEDRYNFFKDIITHNGLLETLPSTINYLQNETIIYDTNIIVDLIKL